MSGERGEKFDLIFEVTSLVHIWVQQRMKETLPYKRHKIQSYLLASVADFPVSSVLHGGVEP